jgi:hypothetical protein
LEGKLRHLLGRNLSDSIIGITTEQMFTQSRPCDYDEEEIDAKFCWAVRKKLMWCRRRRQFHERLSSQRVIAKRAMKSVIRQN